MRTGPSEKFNKALTGALGGAPIREVTEKSLKKPSPDEVEVDEKGGWGSGHFGHSGRPPKVGGSRPGGVKVGRGEMADYASQFKYSGKASLRSRPGGRTITAQMNSGKASGTLMAHGIPAKGGKTKRGMIRLSVGRKSVDLDFRQLHDVRSKARWMNTANTHDVKQTAGRDIVRGESLEITDEEGNSITLPINEATLKELHYATKGAIKEGKGSVSWLAENRGQVQKLAKEFGNQEDPFDWLDRAEVEINGKMQPLSLGGRYAILHHYVFDKMTRESIKRRMRANITKNAQEHGGKEGAKAAYNKVLAEFDRVKDEAEKRLTTYSGTQAMVENMELAAASMFRLIQGSQPRSGRKGKKGAPKAPPKPKAEAPKPPKAEKPREEAPAKPRAEKPRREERPQEAPKPPEGKPQAEKPRRERKPPEEAPKPERKPEPKAEKPAAETGKIQEQIRSTSERLKEPMSKKEVASVISEAEKMSEKLKREGKLDEEGEFVVDMRIRAASMANERDEDTGRARASLRQALEAMGKATGSARKSLDVRSLVQAAFAEVLGL